MNGQDRGAGTSLSTRFTRDGYVHLPGFLDRASVDRLGQAVEVAARDDPGVNELSRDGMRFASNLFRTSRPLQDFLSSHAVLPVVDALLGPSAWVRWDQAVWKGPGGPEFPWHQDNGYTGLPTAHLQLWLALTSMRRDDGALVVVPGGHHRVYEHRWDGSHAVAEVPGTRRVVEAEPGDMVAFSSLLPHSTGCNTTSATRIAYVAEFLPLGVDDPHVPTPHFVAFVDGRPCGRFVPEEARATGSRPPVTPR